jgi:hypothetical protein
MASRKLGDINALEGCIRGSYAFSVVTGYTGSGAKNLALLQNQ